jgi:hypothetical protein
MAVFPPISGISALSMDNFSKKYSRREAPPLSASAPNRLSGRGAHLRSGGGGSHYILWVKSKNLRFVILCHFFVLPEKPGKILVFPRFFRPSFRRLQKFFLHNLDEYGRMVTK